MDPFTIEVFKVTIGAALAALFGGFVKQKLTDKSVLSIPIGKLSKNPYEHLTRRWHEYHATFDKSIQQEPFWLYGVLDIKIKKGYLVEGTWEVTLQSRSKLEFEIIGEIRGGHMIITANCKQDISEFGAAIFSNLLPRKNLIGIYTGFDWQHAPFSGPIILSQSEMSMEELNKCLEAKELDHIIKDNRIGKLFAN